MNTRPASFDPAPVVHYCAMLALGTFACFALVGCAETWTPSAEPGGGMVRPTGNEVEEGVVHLADSDAMLDLNSNYFPTNEVSVGTYAAADFGNGQKRIEHTETAKGTETHFVTNTVLRDIPGTPGLTAVQQTSAEKVSTTHTTHSFETRGPYSDTAWGGGFDVEYFPPRYGLFDTWCSRDTWGSRRGCRAQLGFGMEGQLMDGELFGRVSGKVILRFPIEGKAHLAPYVFAGVGGEFFSSSKVFGYVGGGLEKRFSPHFGIFADARWVFDGDYENAAEIRAGMRFAFGPQAPARVSPK